MATWCIYYRAREDTKQHHENTRLHRSCPPSRLSTITVSVQLGPLIIMIFSEIDGQLCKCACDRDSLDVWKSVRTQSERCRGRAGRALSKYDSALIHTIQSVNSMWEPRCGTWRSWRNMSAPNLSMFPGRRRENPQETPAPIGRSLAEEALPCMYAPCACDSTSCRLRSNPSSVSSVVLEIDAVTLLQWVQKRRSSRWLCASHHKALTFAWSWLQR